MRLTTTRVGILMLALFGAAVGGCGGERADDHAGTPGTPVDGGTAVVAIADEPDVLNSLTRTSAVAGMVLSVVQASLMEMAEDRSWEPMIAERWELSPDSLAITYHLQPWRWEDGKPLTAVDVRRSWELLRDPRVGSPRADLLRSVVGCEALDEATVRYTFDGVQAEPVQVTAHSILPAHLVRDLDPAAMATWPINRTPLASGAFRLATWAPGRQLVLEPNPRYPLAPPHLERLVLRIMPDATARILALEAGEVDVVADISAATSRRLTGSDDIVLHGLPSRVFGLIMWNVRRPALRDPVVRRALSLAVDRQRMVQDLLGGFGEPAASYLPPVVWNHHGDLAPDPCRPDSARALLTSAGWVDTDGDGIRERDGRPLSLNMLYRGGDAQKDNGAALVRQNLKAVGVECRLRSLELATALEFLGEGRFDAYLGEFQANLFADPSPLVASRGAARYNYGGYANDRVDSLLTLALAEPDRRRSLPLWHAVQEELAADQPAAVLYYLERVVAVDARIRDARPHLLGVLNNVTEWWIAPADRRWAGAASDRP